MLLFQQTLKRLSTVSNAVCLNQLQTHPRYKTNIFIIDTVCRLQLLRYSSAWNSYHGLLDKVEVLNQDSKVEKLFPYHRQIYGFTTHNTCRRVRSLIIPLISLTVLVLTFWLHTHWTYVLYIYDDDWRPVWKCSCCHKRPMWETQKKVKKANINKVERCESV